MENKLALTGKITEILQKTGGVSKAGKNWEKQEFLLQYENGQYPKYVILTTLNEATTALQSYKVGDEVTAHINLFAEPYNGKHYNKVMAWKLDGSKANAAPQPAEPKTAEQAAKPVSDDDGLPF